MHFHFVAPIIMLLSTPAAAWGELGHQTVASVATYYLQPEALSTISSILSNDPAHTGTTPVQVAVWADKYRFTKGGGFTRPFHFLDAIDTPPSACDVSFQRDCTRGGCVVSAIANYTSRVTLEGPDAAYQQAQALKFLIHFIGDITQPLHVENIAFGGNEIFVLWHGANKSLHHIWDTEMITQLAGAPTPDDVTAWTTKLTSQIDNGDYTNLVPKWVNCITPSVVGDFEATVDCTTTWAADANAYVCSYVLASDPTGQECSGAYYQGAVPIIQEQIAKAGVRLAAWLNTIFTGSTGFEDFSRVPPRFRIQ